MLDWISSEEPQQPLWSALTNASQLRSHHYKHPRHGLELQLGLRMIFQSLQKSGQTPAAGDIGLQLRVETLK